MSSSLAGSSNVSDKNPLILVSMNTMLIVLILGDILMRVMIINSI
ncbi:hypothetical protein Gotur_010019 [Gossypium turneri]